MNKNVINNMKQHRTLYIPLGLACTLLFMSGCVVGPKFKAPEVTVPETYVNQHYSSDSLANLRWWEIFRDPDLSHLVYIAIENNRDLRMALSRIEQAEISLRITRSQFYPSIQYGINAQYGTQNLLGIRESDPTQSYSIVPTITWELGFFGKVRRMTESAQAQYLSSRYATQATIVSLIANVATTYYALLAYNEALTISEATLLSRTESLELIRKSYAGGATSALELQQAEQLVAQANTAVPQYRRAVAQTTNSLCALIGVNPQKLPGTAKSISSQHIPDSIPAGIPSDLLRRRPDIIEALYAVAAQNAQIGVAQASRLPSLAITGTAGLFNTEIEQLFRAKSFMWSAAGQIASPIFQFGRNKRKVDLEREKTHEAVLNYEQSVISALGEVETALVAVSTYRDQMQSYKALAETAAKTQELAMKLFRGGAESYLNVIDADLTLQQAQLGYIESVNSCISAYVALYKALGGGWATPEEEAAANGQNGNH